MKAEKESSAWLKTGIAVVGAILTLVGFYLDHSEQNNWVVNLFAPSYVTANTTYERMLNEGVSIGSADAGFTEIASICSEKLSGEGDLTIASIAIKRGSAFLSFGTAIAQQYDLEITLRDGRSATGNIEDLKPLIQERFLGDTLFRWSQALVWIGIVLIVFESFILERLFG